MIGRLHIGSPSGRDRQADPNTVATAYLYGGR
jgi:hypothetical protein